MFFFFFSQTSSSPKHHYSLLRYVSFTYISMLFGFIVNLTIVKFTRIINWFVVGLIDLEFGLSCYSRREGDKYCFNKIEI